MKYLIYLPKDYDQKDSWPVLLFLHGSGRGATTWTSLRSMARRN